MIPGVIARRYAKALLEIGTEAGNLDALVEEMGRASTIYRGSDELRAAFENPLVGMPAKKAIMNDVVTGLGLGTTAKNTLGMLLERRRIRALPAIAARLREMADAKRGILRAEVSTAMPLPEEYFERLQRELERMTGQKVALDRKLDQTLICGVVVRLGDTLYDGSLAMRVRQMKEQMLSN